MDVVTTRDGVACLTLTGRLDAGTVAAVRELLHRAVVDAREEVVVVDVAHLEIWDPAGLGVLAGAQRLAARHGRRLVLTSASPRLARMLRAARLHRLLDDGRLAG